MSYSDAACEHIKIQKASFPTSQEVNAVEDVERQASRVYINPERPKALGVEVSTYSSTLWHLLTEGQSALAIGAFATTLTTLALSLMQ